MSRGVVGVAALPSDEPGRAQCRHLHAQAHQGLTMGVEILGIAHPVALNVWTVGVLGIGPPIVAFGEIIVLASSASRALSCGDGDGRLTEIFISRFENPRPVDGIDVETFLASKAVG